MNAERLKAEYASQIEPCLAKYVDTKTARNIVHLLFSNLSARLAGYDMTKAIRPLLFSLAISDALAVRRAKLSPEDRQAFAAAMRDHRETAARLGIPLGTFRVRLRRALRSYAA